MRRVRRRSARCDMHIVPGAPPARTTDGRPTSAGPAHSRPMGVEPKFDGFRAIATADRRRVRLHSRQNRPLTRYFPEIVAAIADRFAGHIVLDGELVVCRTAGLDFMALQRRLTDTRHAADSARHLRRIRRPRRRGHRSAHPPLPDPPRSTPAVARRCRTAARGRPHDHRRRGRPRMAHRAPRRRHRGRRRETPRPRLPTARRAWRKVKTRTSTEAVVGGVLGPLTHRSRWSSAATTRPDACGWPGAPGRFHATPGQPSAPCCALPTNSTPGPPSYPRRGSETPPPSSTRGWNRQSSWNSPSTQQPTSCGVGPSGGTQPLSAESATTSESNDL